MVSLDHALKTFKLYNEAREALHEKMMSIDREYGSIVKTVETALDSMGEDWSTRVLQTSNYKRAREWVSEALARDPELSRYFGGNGRGEKKPFASTRDPSSTSRALQSTPRRADSVEDKPRRRVDPRRNRPRNRTFCYAPSTAGSTTPAAARSVPAATCAFPRRPRRARIAAAANPPQPDAFHRRSVAVGGDAASAAAIEKDSRVVYKRTRRDAGRIEMSARIAFRPGADAKDDASVVSEMARSVILKGRKQPRLEEYQWLAVERDRAHRSEIPRNANPSDPEIAVGARDGTLFLVQRGGAIVEESVAALRDVSLRRKLDALLQKQLKPKGAKVPTPKERLKAVSDELEASLEAAREAERRAAEAALEAGRLREAAREAEMRVVEAAAEAERMRVAASESERRAAEAERRAAGAQAAECPVCMEDIEAGGERVFHPCGHVVCASCAAIFTRPGEVCPLCREPIDGASRVFRP